MSEILSRDEFERDLGVLMGPMHAIVALSVHDKALREQVRVLTEALAAIDRAYEEYIDEDILDPLADAIGAGRSVLASVPSEPPYCPTCLSNDPTLFFPPCTHDDHRNHTFHSVPSEETTPTQEEIDAFHTPLHLTIVIEPWPSEETTP